ncbi:hypothetical protein [Geminisphaera colitermitum]|uniref:hypothetical protein n=1 Tax=Geminisphaera colitermitum TaxID=1148786 RepID=UPI000158C81D|nr:hypothetical protein [Geminisphaera colitermitum]
MRTNPLVHIVGFCLLCITAAGVALAVLPPAGVDNDADLDAIFGTDVELSTPVELPPDVDAIPEWKPVEPLVLPPAVPPIDLRKLPSLELRKFAASLTPVELQALGTAIAQAAYGEVLTAQGLVVLTPPLRGTPLESLASWLRIMQAAGLTELPVWASGTPAWVMWRKLSASPLTTEAQWVSFYKRLKA